MPFSLSSRKVRLATTGQTVGTGWLPPVFDPRDYTDIRWKHGRYR